MKEKSVIIFAPHPDDETLACGGTIAKKISEGYRVFVVFMTDARYSLEAVGMTSGPSPQEICGRRRMEAIEAMKTLGLQEENLFFLNFEDRTLKAHYRDAQRKISEILSNISPVEVYFPQEREYNIDHRVTNMMVQEVLGHLNLNPIKFQYAIAWLFPYNVVAHIFDERKFYSFMSSILNLSIVYEDIWKFLNLKKKALEAYKTQLMAFSYKERKNIIKRSFLNSFLEKKEKFFVTPKPAVF